MATGTCIPAVSLSHQWEFVVGPDRSEGRSLGSPAFALYLALAELNGRVSARRSQDSRRRTSRHDAAAIHIAARDKGIARNGLFCLVHLRWQNSRRSKDWFLGRSRRGESSARWGFWRRQHGFPSRIRNVVGFLRFGHQSSLQVWTTNKAALETSAVYMYIRTFEACSCASRDTPNDCIVPMTGVVCSTSTTTAGDDDSVFGFCGRRPNVSEDCPPDGARTREVVRLCKKRTRRCTVNNQALGCKDILWAAQQVGTARSQGLELNAIRRPYAQ
jgi:hypothetical protein